MAKQSKKREFVEVDSDRLRELRLRATWSQEVLAAKSGISTKTVERLEAGQPCYPNTVALVADALDVPPDSLLVGHTSPERVRVALGSLPPFPRLFVGRDADMELLRKKLVDQRRTKGDHQMTVVHGWPGVGKTTLTAALAHDPMIRTAFPDGVLWASLGQSPNLVMELQRWASDLGFEEVANDAKDLSSKLAAFIWDKQLLVIVDDVWNGSHFGPLDVAGSGCATLVTTRHPKIGNELAPKSTDIIPLGCLNPDDSLQLLHEVAGDVVETFLQQCSVLVDDLEGLPLALNVAGCWLRNAHQKRWNVPSEIEELRSMARLLESQAPANMASFMAETNNITIAALLKKSTDCLDDATLYRFATLGAYRAKPATFPLKMIARAWDADESAARTTVSQLIDFGLMERTDDSLLWIHALLVAFAKTLWTDE